jgi:adenosylmethionine-8-amino-7-oxononanoate aminotransferase
MGSASRLLHRTLAFRPEIAVRGRGIRLTLGDGQEVIDASGGAAVACLGHGNGRVAAAIGRQAAEMAYAHTGFFSSAPAEAMESALKMARQYFLERGEPQRTRFIARRQSYHGNTLGALATGGHAFRRRPYEPLFPDRFSHVWSSSATRLSSCAGRTARRRHWMRRSMHSSRSSSRESKRSRRRTRREHRARRLGYNGDLRLAMWRK